MRDVFYSTKMSLAVGFVLLVWALIAGGFFTARYRPALINLGGREPTFRARRRGKGPRLLHAPEQPNHR
jgi:hypothetical protein